MALLTLGLVVLGHPLLSRESTWWFDQCICWNFISLCAVIRQLQTNDYASPPKAVIITRQTRFLSWREDIDSLQRERQKCTQFLIKCFLREIFLNFWFLKLRSSVELSCCSFCGELYVCDANRSETFFCQQWFFTRWWKIVCKVVKAKVFVCNWCLVKALLLLKRLGRGISRFGERYFLVVVFQCSILCPFDGEVAGKWFIWDKRDVMKKEFFYSGINL